MNIKNELVTMLNEALKLEYAAYLQYVTYAELVKGLYAEKVIERLKELASDEAKHAEDFREMIASYLDSEPVMDLATTHRAKYIDEILKVSLKDEKTAIDFYKKIYHKVVDNKENLPYVFETLEHKLRHIIIDEQEHVVELSLLFEEK